MNRKSDGPAGCPDQPAFSWPGYEALDALPEGEKLLLDLIRMIAYRAETRMMSAVAQAQGKKQRPRRNLRALLQADADIIPEPGNEIVRVRVLGTASNAGDNALAGLLHELNQTRTKFPGTNLRMVYELPQFAPTQNSRVQRNDPNSAARS